MVSTSIGLGVLLGFILVNQVVMRVRALWSNDVVFYGNVVLQGLGGLAVLVIGLPGTGDMVVVRVLVAMMQALHVVQDLTMRAERLREERDLARGDHPSG